MCSSSEPGSGAALWVLFGTQGITEKRVPALYSHGAASCMLAPVLPRGTCSQTVASQTVKAQSPPTHTQGSRCLAEVGKAQWSRRKAPAWSPGPVSSDCPPMPCLGCSPASCTGSALRRSCSAQPTSPPSSRSSSCLSQVGGGEDESLKD